jgi:hypothetical protein
MYMFLKIAIVNIAVLLLIVISLIAKFPNIKLTKVKSDVFDIKSFEC